LGIIFFEIGVFELTFVKCRVTVLNIESLEIQTSRLLLKDSTRSFGRIVPPQTSDSPNRTPEFRYLPTSLRPKIRFTAQKKWTVKNIVAREDNFKVSPKIYYALLETLIKLLESTPLFHTQVNINPTVS